MKNTFVAEIEVPKSKRKSATAILKRIEALIAIAEPEPAILILALRQQTDRKQRSFV